MRRLFDNFGSSARSRSSRSARSRRIARLLHALGEPAKLAEEHGRAIAGRIADGPRGERLAILEHRDRTTGGGDRGREAWVLRVVLGWSDRDAAKALDCSRTALEGHLRTVSDRFDADDVAALRRGISAVGGIAMEDQRRSQLPSTSWSRLRPLAGMAMVAVGLVLVIRWLG